MSRRRETPAPARAVQPRVRRIDWLIVAALVVLTLAGYWRIGTLGFVNLDDDAYVEFQPMVNLGLRSAAIVWAFTAAHSSNWHPLTSMSHMLDCDVFGVAPAPMHWENLLWHAANTLLVFAVWKSLTSARWRSAAVAALFALHPLHVESVAWISERKDVLSAFFFLLTLWFYARYARANGRRSVESKVRAPIRPKKNIDYFLALVAFALGLMSKPMLVTLPFVLLVVDFWPLERFADRGALRARIVEKIPFFALAAADAIATFFVQRASGAASYGLRFSAGQRVGNAIVSIVRYLAKAFWPESLSVFYAHPGSWPASRVAASAALIAVVFAAGWWQRNRRPWIAFGWLLFIGMLVPVLGLVQVGAQSMADRYTYLPLLGIFTAVVWSAGELSQRAPAMRIALAAAATLALAACAFVTQRQVATWRNSIALYQHSIAVGEDSATVRYLLAVALQSAGRPEAEVVAQFRRALALQPDYVNALTQLAVFAFNHGRADEARELIERAIRLDPRNPGLHKNLGAYYVRLGRPKEAVRHFDDALRIDPTYADAHHELAWIALNENRLQDARVQLEAVVAANPWDADALCELGTLAANLGDRAEGRRLLERAVWIRPEFPRAVANLRALM